MAKPLLKLNSPSFFESDKSAVLLDGLEPFYRDIHNNSLVQFADVNAAPLEIRFPADLAGRVELRRAGTVRVPPADLRALTGNLTGACHSRPMVA